MKPPWEVVKKVFINGPGHMKKMAAMPIYGKNLQKPSTELIKSYDLEKWHGFFLNFFTMSNLAKLVFSSPEPKAHR